jgi:hypothetical protein
VTHVTARPFALWLTFLASRLESPGDFLEQEEQLGGREPAALIFSQVALSLIIVVPSSLPKPWRCQTQKGANTMIMERGARPDAVPKPKRGGAFLAAVVVLAGVGALAFGLGFGAYLLR